MNEERNRKVHSVSVCRRVRRLVCGFGSFKMRRRRMERTEWMKRRSEKGEERV